MTDDQIRLDLPALAAGRPFSHVAEEAALVYGCVRDEIEAAGEVMRAMLTRAPVLADAAARPWYGHAAVQR
jgi:hypothetical protein